jgi:RNA polymerase sigma factor (sigma-70 family)
MTLEEFLDRLKQENSKNVLGDVYSACRNNCVLWLLKQGKTENVDIAKDIFTEAVLVLFDNAEKGKIVASSTQVQTYLITTCFYIQSNLNKRNGKPSEWDFDILIGNIAEEHPDLAIEKEALLVRLEDAFTQLGEPCKSLFRMFVLENLSHQEIAEIMDYTSKDVSKSLYYKCKKGFIKNFGPLF